MRTEQNLTDEELCMLEQLCYLGPEVGKAAGLEGFSGITERDTGLSVGDILEAFDGEALANLRKLGDEETGRSCISGTEWADIIEYAADSRLKELVVQDTMPGEEGISLAVTYTFPGETDHAVTAFKGTTGDGEWVDNMEGMHMADTPAQQAAFMFIEEQPYARITVTGHSKGANKAMYAAVLSDRVDRCAAFDGQGFSGEFIEKYGAEIRERADRITNYSIDTDFVHILLYPVPGSRQLYCRGFGIDNVKQNHSSNSFFQTDAGGSLLTDAGGLPVIVTQENGRNIPEDPSLTFLHRFTAWMLNNAEKEELAAVTGYLAALVPVVRSERPGSEKAEEVMRITGENTDAASSVIAWFAAYVDQYGYDTSDIDRLLQALGLDTLDETAGFSIPAEEINEAGFPMGWERFASRHGMDPAGFHGGLSTVITLILERLMNGRDDADIRGLMTVLDAVMASGTGIRIHAADIWQEADRKAVRISGTAGAGDRQAAGFRIRDFSDEALSRLTSAMDRSSVIVVPAGAWQAWSGEEWYDKTGAALTAGGLDALAGAAEETNRISKAQAGRIFSEVRDADAAHAAGLEGLLSEAARISALLSEMAAT